MSPPFHEVDLIQQIPAVRSILDVVCRSTGMGFAAVARVTDTRWTACAVLDRIAFGLEPGGELELATTICNEIRQHHQPVVIDEVNSDACFRDHPTPRKYGFQSYLSVPIFTAGNQFFGTLCAIDPRPARLHDSGALPMFQHFAELIGFHLDAARVRLTESSLAEERENSRLREQFIAVLGHDLRNPLSAITVGTGLLKEAKLEPTAARLVEVMDHSAHAMAGLIEDAMDFARGRLGSGIPLEEVVEQPLQPLLEFVVAEHRELFPTREIIARFDLAGPVRFDARRLSQLAGNLLANAVTHGTPGTPVTLEARTHAGRLELSVTNAGEAMPPEVAERLFQPFHHPEPATHRKGLGLGLFIASEIARAHGGTLTVSSFPGEIRFTFSMPLRPTSNGH